LDENPSWKVRNKRLLAVGASDPGVTFHRIDALEISG